MPLFGRPKKSSSPPNLVASSSEVYIALEAHSGVREEDAALLSLLDRPRPIEGHLSRLREAGWASDGPREIKAKLHDLVDRGLVVTKADLLRMLQSNSKVEEENRRITTMLWPTYNRKFELERSIRSFAANIIAHDRHVRYLVSNSYYGEEHEKDLEATLGAIARELGIDIWYAGYKEKKRYGEQLGDALLGEGIDPSLVEFAIFDNMSIAPDYGATRNATLLATVGELVLTADDDTQGTFSTPNYQAQNQGCNLTSSADPTSCSFYEDRDALIEAVNPCETDILSLHESMLGRPLGSALESNGALSSDTLDISGISPSFASSILKTRPRIAATATGLYGDSAFDLPLFLLTLQGTSRNNLCASGKTYNSAFMSREMCRSVSRPTVSSGRFLMTVNLGLDNREDLPPFFPVYRAEDINFAYILKICYPDLLIGYHPTSVYHVPAQVRKYSADRAAGPKFRMPLAVELSVGYFSRVVAAPAYTCGIEHLGAFFEDIGSLSNIDFMNYLWEIWTRYIGAYLEHLESLLDRYKGKPGFWADDVRACIENTERMLTAGIRAVDPLVAGRSMEESLDTCRNLFTRYGQLLSAWKVIRRCAATLNETGKGIAKQVTH